MYVCSNLMKRPAPRSMSGICVCFFAKIPSMPPLPMPIMPTFATSPSISALVACVVLCAIKTTSFGEMSFFCRHSLKHSITPAATPILSSCVVLTMDSPMISCVLLSIATAFVCVPPTSIPILTSLFIKNSSKY